MFSSRARAASGIPVMPTMSQPSLAIRSISAAVSRRGPWVAPYTPPSYTSIPAALPAVTRRSRSPSS